jgi:two-component system response regulator FixJ
MRETMESAGQPAPVVPPTLVHLVDDDQDVLKSLALLLRTAGHRVATHPDAMHLLEALDAGAEGGCAVVDVRMPGMDGLALARAIKSRSAPLPVVIVTGHADVALAVRAMREGAVDLIEKPYDEARMLDAVAAALASGAAVTSRRRDHDLAVRRLTVLSAREREVFDCLVEGMSNKQVATRLGISVRTAEVHRANLMEKLGADGLPAMVKLAIAAGRDA